MDEELSESEKVRLKLNERLSGKAKPRLGKPRTAHTATKDRSLRGKKRKGAKKLPPNEMHVEVTDENITRFALDTLTGNSREELLSLAAEAEETGTVLTVKLPNMSRDANLFDLGLEETVEEFDNERCRYEAADEHNTFVCIIHGGHPKHLDNDSIPIGSCSKVKEE